jgi:ABC-type transport system involved in multi-copper enzyme maturation permease subunit
MNLILIEWFKLKNHRFFWIGMGLFIVLMVLLLVSVGQFDMMKSNGTNAEGETEQVKMTLGNAGFYKLPLLWQNTSYLAGFFKFIPAFLLLFFVASEYQYRTLRQNIIDGLTVNEFFWSKIFSLLLFTVISVLAVGLTSVALAGQYNDLSTVSLWERSEYLLGLFAEFFFLLSFALFLGILVRRSAIAIIVLLLYYFLLEPVLGFALGEPIASYLPTRPSRNLIEEPFTRLLKVDQFLGIERADSISWRNLLISFLYGFGFCGAALVLLKKRDL